MQVPSSEKKVSLEFFVFCGSAKKNEAKPQHCPKRCRSSSKTKKEAKRRRKVDERAQYWVLEEKEKT